MIINVAYAPYVAPPLSAIVAAMLSNRSWPSTRVTVAVMIALTGSVLVWLLVPYNNYWLGNTYISDSYLPEIVVALLLLLVLGINPLLRLIGPGWVLDRRQVALVGSLLLFAAIIPGNGLMRMFPRMVAESNQGFHASVTTARIAADAGFRQSLFPDPLPTRSADGGVQTVETPVSRRFLDELEEGEALPWSAWVAPMASWGMLILAMWAMMIGLGGVVYPQWRDNERLPFPLLNVYHALTGDPDDTSPRLLPAVFYSRSFWIAAIAVFGIHGLRGLNVFTGAVPSIPLQWSLREYFSEGIFRNAPASFSWQIVFFSVIGVAYFIPNRYAISVWGWVVGYSVYVMLGRAFVPAFQEGQINDQSFGALLAIAAWVLWLGRAHWGKVGRAMLGRADGGPESRRDALAGWMFAIGCAGIVCWLYWAGCSLWWSVLAMLGCALVTLLMARIIAETGVPVLWLGRISVGSLTALFPLQWQSPRILFFTAVLYALLTRTSAVSAGVMTTMSLGMDRKATAGQQSRLLGGGLAVMALGFVICGAVHLYMGYHTSTETTQAKMGASAIDAWSRVERSEYRFFTGDRGQQATGFGISAALLWACSRFPAWPIHPVGMIFCQLSIGHLLWFSIFMGWLIKSGITSLFGAGAYRQARPAFLGLILGELAAVMMWALVPAAIVLLTDTPPEAVPHYTLMQYP